MKRLDIRDPRAFDMAVEALQSDAIVVQLPTVFVLLAAPTTRGAAQLDRAKARLQGKNYGTAIGSLARFLAQADPAHLPAEFSTVQQFERMTGSFIRLRFREPGVQTPVMRDGSHQGVLLRGVHRELFKRLEAAFLGGAPDPLWVGRERDSNYAAPLCTSCNISGDPQGSITELGRALDFARDRDVGLMITCPDSAEQLGSYPIFGFEKHRVSVHRDGPYLAYFKQQIPRHLRAWEQARERSLEAA